MTAEQKNRIARLRYVGKNYTTIGAKLGLNANTVKTYCNRNGLSDKEIKAEAEKQCSDICKHCGKPLVYKSGRRRVFCSDACRSAWWYRNRDLHDDLATYKHICVGCGKEFIAYGNKNRKYCCHACYIQDRFSEGKADDATAIPR